MGRLIQLYNPVLPTGFLVRKAVLEPSGKILLAGVGVPTPTMLVRLNPDGSPDIGFATPLLPGLGPWKISTDAPWSGSKATTGPRDLLLQPDGKILAGGMFLDVNGRRTVNVARFHSDGTLDTNFVSEMWIEPGSDAELTATVDCLCLTVEGKVLIAGFFESINTVGPASLARLFGTDTDCAGVISFSEELIFANEQDGAAELTVTRSGGTNQAITVDYTAYGSHFAYEYWWLWPVESALEGEDFVASQGTLSFGPGETQKTISIPLIKDTLPENYERLAVSLASPTGDAVLGFPYSAAVTISDAQSASWPGSVASTFNPKLDGEVQAILVLPDNSILVAGSFSTVNGVTCKNLAKLQPDGSLDPAFHPGIQGMVQALAWLPGANQVLLGGDSTVGANPTLSNLVRLDLQGTLDGSFQSMLDGPVSLIVALPNSQILVSGKFTTVNGSPRPGLARLESNGSLDASCAPPAELSSNQVRSLALQTDGKVLLCGGPVVIRLLSNGDLDSSFEFRSSFSLIDAKSLTVRRPGKKWWTARVTLPVQRIKSPMPSLWLRLHD